MLMKLFNRLSAACLALAAAVGCTDGIAYTPGEPENPGNYGVYFPTQISATDIQIEPAAKTEVTYRVRRTNTDDDITVPVVVRASEENIFIIEPIEFEDGVSETTFTVYFPDAQVGTTYTCDISIEDPAYASVYGTRSTGLSLSVLRASWKLLGTGRWRDDVVSSLYLGVPYPNAEIDVQVYEREDMPGYYRVDAYTSDFIYALFGQSLSTAGERTIIDATDPDQVWIPKQSTGVTINSSDGVITIVSYVDKVFSIDASDSQYGTLRDKIITFPVQGIYINLANLMADDEWYPVNTSGMQRLVLPGGHVYDYSVALSSREAVDGVLTVTAKLGEDVARMRYAVFEGELDEGQVSLYAQDLDAGNLAFEERSFTESGSFDITLDESGFYTLIGCTYDAEGSMQGYSSVSFGYVAAGDSRPVMLTVGLESTDELAGQGIDRTNAVKFYAYGEGIRSLTYGIYRVDRYGSVPGGELLDDSGVEFTSEELEALNAKNFRTMLTGLNGDSEYVLHVRADNGYTSRLFSVTCRTSGEFNPGLELYDYGDFLSAQPAKEELFGTTWNYYAIDLMGDTPVRRLIGQVTISENTADDTSTTDYIDISGLSGETLDGGSDRMKAVYMPGTPEYRFHAGCFIPQVPSNGLLGTIGGESCYVGFVCEESSYVYFQPGMFVGAVADGYLYFVPNPILAEDEQMTFRFFFVGNENDLYGLYMELMLVDASKDMGLTTATRAHIGRMRETVRSLTLPRNYVELPRFGAADAAGGAKLPATVNLASGFLPAGAPAAKPVAVRSCRSCEAESGAAEEVRLRTLPVQRPVSK